MFSGEYNIKNVSELESKQGGVIGLIEGESDIESGIFREDKEIMVSVVDVDSSDLASASSCSWFLRRKYANVVGSASKSRLCEPFEDLNSVDIRFLGLMMTGEWLVSED